MLVIPLNVGSTPGRSEREFPCFCEAAVQKCPPLTVYSKMFTLRLKVTRISLAV